MEGLLEVNLITELQVEFFGRGHRGLLKLPVLLLEYDSFFPVVVLYAAEEKESSLATR